MEDKISKLKFKATYGLVGNDAIGKAEDRFFYMSNINMNEDRDRTSSFGKDFGQNYNGITITRYANELITWEKSRKLNVGVELNLFNSLEIQADYFYEKRTDILMERSHIPSTIGLQAQVAANLREASGRGVDFSVDYSHSFSKDLWLQGRVNYTYAVSKYLKVEEPDYGAEGTPWRYLKELSLAQKRGYIAERLFIDEADVANSPVQNFGGGQVMAGDIKYKNIDGDGVITEADMVPIGYPENTPEISYGFGLSGGYKNFDISLFFQGNARSSFWLNLDHITPFVDTDENREIDSSNALLKRIADSHWSEANRDIYAFWLRLANYKSANNSQVST
ncbi:MAG: TonB-dependent receptor [Bacteroides sp.]|nr:TonB-dependent receptor [Bacteroides sp.]